MVTLMQRRRNLFLTNTIEAVPSVDEYVHDSMILWLDGIQNTRGGHNGAAAAWEDLSGNARDYIYSPANTINDDHFLANGNGITSKKALPIDGSIKTVEIVLGFIRSSSGQVFIPLGNRFGTTSFGSYSGTPYILFEATDVGVFSNHVFPRSTDAGVHTYNSSGYIDAEAVQWQQMRASWWTSTPSYLFCFENITKNVPTSKIYALRLYSRSLTETEIKRNAALDAVRFGG